MSNEKGLAEITLEEKIIVGILKKWTPEEILERTRKFGMRDDHATYAILRLKERGIVEIVQTGNGQEIYLKKIS